MSYKTNLASFTFTELFKDLNHDKIFLFILSYEYDLNFNQVLTLYEFSPEIFWSYINILKPMLKLGDRKAQMLKKSANNVYYTLLGNQLNLSEKEREYVLFLSQYVNDSFTDGEFSLHFTQITNYPLKVKGYFINSSNCKTLSTITLNSVHELFRYIDSIESIIYEGKELYKTSRMQYMLDKYYADLTIKEIRLKSVKEAINMMKSEVIEAHYNYINELQEKRDQAREERVNGTQEETLEQETQEC